MRYAQPPIFDAQGRRLSYPAVSSVTLNPMMGHVRYAYTAQTEEDLTLCARYDLNVYSYLSDLTLGAEYCLGPPADDDDARTAEAPTASLREQRGVWKPAPASTTELSLREDTLEWPAGPAGSAEPAAPAGPAGPAGRTEAPVGPAVSAVKPAPAARAPAARAPAATAPAATAPASAPRNERETRAASAPAAVRRGESPEVSATMPSASRMSSTPAAPGLPPAPPYGLLKMRASASGLFALLWEGRWNQCLVSAGVQTQVSMHPKLSATSTLGCEIVYTDE